MAVKKRKDGKGRPSIKAAPTFTLRGDVLSSNSEEVEITLKGKKQTKLKTTVHLLIENGKKGIPVPQIKKIYGEKAKTVCSQFLKGEGDYEGDYTCFIKFTEGFLRKGSETSVSEGSFVSIDVAANVSEYEGKTFVFYNAKKIELLAEGNEDDTEGLLGDDEETETTEDTEGDVDLL